MITHLSYSALRSYLSNPQEFQRKYIHREQDTTTSPALLEGKAFHRGVELYIQGKDPYLPKDLLSFVWKGEEIKFGKTQTLETMQISVENGLGNWHKEDTSIFKGAGVTAEEFIEADIGIGVPVKGYVDATVKESGIVLYDWKLVRAPSSGEENVTYLMQAYTYYLIKKALGEHVSRVEMWEVSKAKNPKVPVTKRVYEAFPEEEVIAVQKLYQLAVDELAHGSRHFLPNLFGQYDGEESWKRWVERAQTIEVPDRNLITDLEDAPY